MVLLVLTVVAVPGLLGQENEVDLEGTWIAYRVSDLSNYRLADYHQPPAMEDLQEGTLTLDPDGEAASTFITVESWLMDDGFLILQNDDRSRMYVPRPLGENTVYLLAVTVTERNREVTHIRVDRHSSYLVVRE